MRPSFERHLREYGKLIKDQMSAEDSEALEKLETVIEYHVERAAKTQETTIVGQEKIFEIQKEKQRIMERLHENLRCLDDENCTPERPESSRLVTFNEKENKFFVEMPNGSQETATLGDILTDGDWGLMYYLDSQTMPRMAQKKFFVESAKRELRNLLDEQLSEQDLDSFKIPGQPRGSLRGIVGSRKMVNKSGGFNLEKRPEYVGFVAEVIVKNLFQQLRFDGVLDVRVVEGDVYQDAVEKIDFIIHTKQHKRGVDVEVDEVVSHIAVQFTTERRNERLRKKILQLEEVRASLIESGLVDDIILVRVPMKGLVEHYTNWIKGDMPPGGPITYIPPSVRKMLLQEVLKGIPNFNEVENVDEIEENMIFRINERGETGQKISNRELIKKYLKDFYQHSSYTTKVLQEEQLEDGRIKARVGLYIGGEFLAEGEGIAKEPGGKPEKSSKMRSSAISRAKGNARRKLVKKIKNDARVRIS
ncbi:MAG: hypothetical protein A3F94_01850 [Candidatus Spechtbacteria bacterium RIFCSPLOWO2_12_FULL_38_22]|uniref:Uncharacterized protein n=1 Tax=Candidatus Spechtbacteria bacterium RIFCSPLOWO2_12_FULL_38_22 TaxID=1802165 RepID=A0A1G2HH10_9BACT|nr:MAG: hypothetical protein A3E58_00345 [Candidatus Spechtbacteria bacterium RIFCSPHIGHO2_12_FULL_38_30]OGZ60555.1 MAG: hypothetical protein A3A00_02810 [Candidatus Spechtbacteria bacterium RIFCSPLOWO2_01_FULL_38_20]OGZ61669.1 MAG: hypothetical protein A3F94_01850 [Candidatus Spechtbacteria bacterium RIFCSPLOWO2_12_FULL_38_22]